MHALLKAVAACPAYSIIGGGDTAALLECSAMLNSFDYVSTGGGALLAYLSGASLPGLEPFLEHV
jgi:phosphoglycerate kinase